MARKSLLNNLTSKLPDRTVLSEDKVAAAYHSTVLYHAVHKLYYSTCCVYKVTAFTNKLI